MPFQTTPLLPSTVSVSEPPKSLTLSAPEPPRDEQHKGHKDRPALAPSSAASDVPALTSSSGKSNPPAASSAGPFTHARRYTLSRFPLLRKGSRELSRTPSASSRSPADLPFYATGAPRASQTIVRGRDISPSRESAAPTPDTSNVIVEEAENTQPHLSRAARPDKMHQTSSRLLRMTDDERPFTRVSTDIHYLPEYGSIGKARPMVTSHSPGNRQQYTTYTTTRRKYVQEESPKVATKVELSHGKPPKVHGRTILKLENSYFVLGDDDFHPMFLRPRKMRAYQNKKEYGHWADGHLEDFKDLFSTLMVSLPLTAHRVRFRMIDFTFTSDEAITNLGSLKFSQSNRMPDPKDSSRVVTTTTTTTFSMAKEMARSVCQKFLEAKFVESVEGKTDFMNKSSVWQLTPKGIHILERFCTRNGIASAHVKAVIESNRNPRQLVVLERNTDTDKLHHDEQTVEIIFRRFIGTTANETQSDSDSIHEFSKCDIGVKLVKHRPTSQRQYEYTFHGRNAAQWLMDCSTMVDPREAVEVGSLFLQLKLIAPVDPRNSEHQFQPSKQVHYYITNHGERIAGWLLEEVPTGGDIAVKSRDGVTRDSNSNRTNVIIRNPSWRLLYREFLKETMCEENLSFYLEVQDFKRQYNAAISDKGDNKVETIRETLAAAYGLYNAFLAPGSPNELNIDHGLRTQLATRMTRAVGDDAAMLQSLNEVANLFEKAQQSIFKLMSSDSVPKFVKHPKYAPQLRGLDAAAASAYVASPTAARS